MRKKNNLEVFLSSYAGKRFFNLFYSWGASIVIIGAMFKILHLPFGNQFLMIGMITEALVFFVSGFDLSSFDDEDYRAQSANGISSSSSVSASSATTANTVAASGDVAYQPSVSQSYPTASCKQSARTPNNGSIAVSTDLPVGLEQVNEVSSSVADAYKQMADNAQSMIDDSADFAENMKTLNKNILSLNTVYESQLTSISDQISAVKYINESLERIKRMYDYTLSDTSVFRMETERMTRQIEALNNVYARLLQAMTSNHASPPPPPQY